VIDAKTDLDEQDDLTLCYMYGFKNGRDSMKDEIARLRMALREIAAYDTDAEGNWGFFRDEADAALGEKTDG
jgi:hypothetical protein